MSDSWNERVSSNFGCAFIGLGCLGIVLFGAIAIAGFSSGGPLGLTAGWAGLVFALSSLGMAMAVGLPMLGIDVPKLGGLAFAALMVLVLIAMLTIGRNGIQQAQQQQQGSGSPAATSIKPVFHPGQLGQSVWKQGGYAAQVTKVTGIGASLVVTFDAEGRDDLLQPEASCIRVPNPKKAGERLEIHPASSRLTTESAGRYAGTLTFPVIVPGSYGFQYGCQDGYSEVDLGVATNIPVIGISEFSPRFFAVIFAVTHSGGNVSIQFAAVGDATLRAPETSCLNPFGASLVPTVSFDWRAERQMWNDPLSSVYVGKMKFKGVRGGSFVYSCSGDYSAVVV